MVEIKYLSNGIPVLIDKVDDIQSFTLGIFVKTGAKNELADEFGISHYIEHMMFKGTKTRSAKELSEIIDDVGGSMNAYTSRDTTCYYVKMLSSKLDIAVDVFADMFMNSTFTEENLEKERNVIIEEIKMYEDIPEEIIHDVNLRFSLDGEYGNSVLGTEESLKGIDREKFLNYFNSKYVPENIGISIAGNFDIEAFITKLENSFGKMETGKLRVEESSKFNINSQSHKIPKESNQVHLCFNTLGTTLVDDARWTMSILSNILGENMSSRLFQKIREERGLAYSVYCYLTSYNEGGLFTVYAGTNLESYLEVIDLIVAEFELIKKEGISEIELERAKNQLISMLTFALENSRGKMVRMWNSYVLYGEILTVEEINRKILGVTLEDVKSLANRLFNEESYSITTLGNF